MICGCLWLTPLPISLFSLSLSLQGFAAITDVTARVLRQRRKEKKQRDAHAVLVPDYSSSSSSSSEEEEEDGSGSASGSARAPRSSRVSSRGGQALLSLQGEGSAGKERGSDPAAMKAVKMKARSDAKAMKVVRRHLRCYLLRTPLGQESFAAWIADLHPENITVDPR